MIPHTYQTIPGWFDFQELYAEAVRRTPDGGTICEVGTFLGKSLTFLATEIVNSGKSIELVSVDIMSTVVLDWLSGHDIPMCSPFEGKSLSDILEKHLGECQQAGLVWTHWTGTSPIIAGFLQQQFDFVFIDADHRYEAIKADIAAWWPKVKAGGRLAGHDYTMAFPGVIQAVNEVFAGNVVQIGSSWCVDKP